MNQVQFDPTATEWPADVHIAIDGSYYVDTPDGRVAVKPGQWVIREGNTCRVADGPHFVLQVQDMKVQPIGGFKHG